MQAVAAPTVRRKRRSRTTGVSEPEGSKSLARLTHPGFDIALEVWGDQLGLADDALEHASGLVTLPQTGQYLGVLMKELRTRRAAGDLFECRVSPCGVVR
jgi:hypothetical protein